MQRPCQMSKWARVTRKNAGETGVRWDRTVPELKQPARETGLYWAGKIWPCWHACAGTRRRPGGWQQRRGVFSAAGCPICGYRGVFIGVGHPRRWDARCPNCGSRERHRLLHLGITEDGGDKLAGRRILDFALEKAIVRRMNGDPLYETADLNQPGISHTVDITDTGLPDAAYDIVIANHVLEHIPDDRRAMRELLRLLQPGGLAGTDGSAEPDAADHL